ncbi:MAG: hypothetical protein M1281_04615 [Chloroflexi bacterium]|nr:hypothetical protein [Chloroflexota bacterium]
MNQPDVKKMREKTISRYVKALDSSDLDEIAAVLQISETDGELDRIISEINVAYAEELGLSPISLAAEQVRDLLQQHFPSAFGEPQEIPAITVSEVAAHLVANRMVAPADKETNLKLLRVHIPLPAWLSLPEIRMLGQQFGFNLSERFLKVFRDAAIQMSMGRGQAQMTAARRKTSRRRAGGDNSDKENNA